MKELSEICAAFAGLCGEGKSAALATVVAVEGSAYRRPGARMLIAEDGRTWGGVSGGCLERDVARRGRGVIETGKPVICRYDTADDEELAGGVATGCGGAIELFVQRISASSAGPLPFIEQVLETRKPLTVATILRAAAGHEASEGGCLAVDQLRSSRHDSIVSPSLRQLLIDSIAIARPSIICHREGNQSADVFVEQIMPPLALIVFGAGPDAVPVAQIAKSLGWHVSVVGIRPATDLAARFRMADALHVTSSEAPLEGVAVTPDSAVVLMTHNFARDIRILMELPKPLKYLGILGPRRRTDEVLAQVPADAALDAAYAPVGLDLQAETPEEIALSIIAEIQAVTRQATCRPLRDRPGPIHPESCGQTPSTEDDGRTWSSTCPV